MKVKNVLLWFLWLAVCCGVFYGFGFLLRATGTTWFGNGPINPQEIPPFVWSILGGAVYVSVHLATWISACLDDIYEREAEEEQKKDALHEALKDIVFYDSHAEWLSELLKRI